MYINPSIEKVNKVIKRGSVNKRTKRVLSIRTTSFKQITLRKCYSFYFLTCIQRERIEIMIFRPGVFDGFLHFRFPESVLTIQGDFEVL